MHSLKFQSYQSAINVLLFFLFDYQHNDSIKPILFFFFLITILPVVLHIFDFCVVGHFYLWFVMDQIDWLWTIYIDDKHLMCATHLQSDRHNKITTTTKTILWSTLLHFLCETLPTRYRGAVTQHKGSRLKAKNGTILGRWRVNWFCDFILCNNTRFVHVFFFRLGFWLTVKEINYNKMA